MPAHPLSDSACACAGRTRRQSLTTLAATALALLTGGLAVTPAAAQSDWPAAGRTIRLIVPSPGGSGTGDTIARIFAEEMAKRLKTTFVVDNKPGANGNVGATAAAQAAGDGYNFLFSWAGTLAVNQAMYKQMGYDSQRDFLPSPCWPRCPTSSSSRTTCPCATSRNSTPT